MTTEPVPITAREHAIAELRAVLFNVARLEVAYDRLVEENAQLRAKLREKETHA